MCTREENLKKLFENFEEKEVQYYMSNCLTDEELQEAVSILGCSKDLTSAQAEMVRQGLFSRTPMLVEDSLVYSVDKYLHWFRGYYFQMSSTHNGIGCVHNSCTRLHYLEDSFNDKHMEYNNFVFTTCALITALHFYDVTMDLLSTKDGVAEFNKFLQVSAENEYLVSNNVCLDNCMKYVTKEEVAYKPNFDIYGGKTINILCNYGKPKSKATLGVLNICENAVRFMYQTKDKNYTLYTINTPDYISKQSELYVMLVEFLIAYAGFRVVWYDIYPLNKLAKEIIPITYNCKDSATELREIIPYIKEMLS